MDATRSVIFDLVEMTYESRTRSAVHASFHVHGHRNWPVASSQARSFGLMRVSGQVASGKWQVVSAAAGRNVVRRKQLSGPAACRFRTASWFDRDQCAGQGDVYRDGLGARGVDTSL